MTNADLKLKIAILQEKIKLLMGNIDQKISILIPNAKLKKMAIVSVAGFGILFFMLIILAAFMGRGGDSTFVLNKPDIVSSSPLPQKESTNNQKLLNDLRDETEKLKFPPAELTPFDMDIGKKLEKILNSD